jgi:molybdopterin-containing oxidoreductase family iron-sulfur binding subunit
LALPSCHNLESWNDAAVRLGTTSICQPVISPLFGSRQEADSLLKWSQALADGDNPIKAPKDFHDYLKLQNEKRGTWDDLLRLGGLFQPRQLIGLWPSPLNRDEAERMAGEKIEAGEFEVVIRPHHAIYDGRFANNAWLQELPDPVSKIVWDNVATMSPGTASKLGVAEGDRVTVKVADRSVQLPAAVQRGMADGVVVLTLGHGRTAGGVVAIEAGGANVAPLLGREDASRPHLALKAQVARTEGSRQIVRTQRTFHTEDRPIVLDGTLDEYREDANFVKHRRHIPEMTQLYKGWDYSKGHKWAMAIDLSRCVGCEACVAACQAENNIPIVGREQVGRGRVMHWIRIDRYEDGPPDNFRIHHEPMLCQHCDNAPCENVCPVNATAHSPEGLNEMAYNRCVGTRYCSNNCPYKVRRFNFLRYHDAVLRDPVQELVFNPQVTVRGVGVMEKCTFCVQRINAAKFEAANAGVKLADGAIQTACAQACPAGAIVFGDLNDPESEIARRHRSERAFWILQELNTAPNVTYLARVRNPARTLNVEGEHRGTLHE